MPQNYHNSSNFYNTLNLTTDHDEKNNSTINDTKKSDNTSGDKNNLSVSSKNDTKPIVPSKLPIERKKTNIPNIDSVLTKNVYSPIWLSVSESAKLGGVTSKTIRRALQAKKIKYKIVKNRYHLDFSSVIAYLHTKTKLKNKLNFAGIGQYILKWKD